MSKRFATVARETRSDGHMMDKCVLNKKYIYIFKNIDIYTK